MKHSSRPTLPPVPVADQLASLAEPIRLRVLRIAEREELSVGELAQVVQLPQSTVSRHLKSLLDCGWLTRRNEGTATYYRLILDDLPAASRAVWIAVRDQLAGDELTADLGEDERRLRSVIAERREDSQAFFGRVAGQWDQVRTELFGGRLTPLGLLGLIPAGWTIADLGCGTGNAAELLAPLVRRVVAVDRSAPMLRAAQKRLSELSNVEFREGTFENLPLENGSVDAAVAVLVFHHLPDPDAACREIARILKPGGTVLLVDMVDHDRTTYRHTMGHRWMGFSEQSTQSMLESAGFSMVRYVRLPPDPVARGPGLFLATGVKLGGCPGNVEK